MPQMGQGEISSASYRGKDVVDQLSMAGSS